MQSVILAGGIGTRLRPLTEKIPKPMVVVGGKPFLQYQLELLKSFGLKKILLLVSYLGNQIEDFFGNGSKFGMEIEYCYEETPLGTGGALKHAEYMLDDEFLLLNGDTYLPIDYRILIETYYNHRPVGLITAYDNNERIVPNNLAVDESNVVTNYNKRNMEGMTHVDAGVLILRKEVVELIPAGKVCSLEEEIFSKLIERNNLMAFPTSKRFYDIGTFNEIEVFRSMLA